MKRKCMLSCAVALVGLMANYAMANGFMDITFSGDTVGSPPATNTTIGYPITQPYGIGGYDYDANPNNGVYKSPPTAADGTILVGDTTGMSKGAILTTNSADNQIGSLWLDTQYVVPGNFLKLSFDLNVLSGTTATGQSGTLTSNSSTVDTLFGVNTFSSSDTLRFNAVATSATGGVYGIRTTSDGTNFNITPFFTYANGDTHTVELDANYVTGKLDVLVDGVPELSNFSFSATPDPTATLFESFFYLNGDLNTSNNNSVALDNIGATVPLPSAAWGGFVLLGGLGLFGGIKRLRRRAI